MSCHISYVFLVVMSLLWKTSGPEAVLRFKLATAAGLIDVSDTGCLVSAITWFSKYIVATHPLVSFVWA